MGKFEDHLREVIKADIKHCRIFQKELFVRMYGADSNGLPLYTLEEIEECIDNIPDDKLIRIEDQIARTIVKNIENI